MAASQTANLVEKAVGHGDNATITTDISNYKNEYGRDSGDLILATTWQGKKSIKMGMSIMVESVMVLLTTDSLRLVEMPKPRVVDAGDVIVKVTGSTICGSDIHLYHGKRFLEPIVGLL